MGNPIDPSYIPVELFNFGQRMSFLERTANTLGRYSLSLLWKLCVFNHSCVLCSFLFVHFFDYFYFGTMDREVQELLNLPESPKLVMQSN